MTRPGVVTGLRSEAALVRAAFRAAPDEAWPLLACAGEDPRAAARRLVEAGAGALLSFGLAGGLDPELRAGALVIPAAVVLPGGEVVETDAAWRAVAGGGEGRLAGCDAPLSTPDEKEALRARTAAVAADMESHGVAVAAREAGVPLLVVRAVVDAADDPLPPAALRGLGPDRRVHPLAVVGGLLRWPGQIPAVLRLARASAAAHAALRAWLDRPGGLRATGYRLQATGSGLRQPTVLRASSLRISRAPGSPRVGRPPRGRSP